MNRRNVMLAFTGAAAATAAGALPHFARAQSSTAMQTGPGQTIGPVDYRRMTLEAGTFAKQSSEVAAQQAADPRVKEFAGFEIAEQTAVAQVLTDMANPPPVKLDPTHVALIEQLTTQQGKSFDRAYIEGQIAGHQALLTIQQDYLNLPPADRDLQHIAVLARMTIMMHLTMLQDLRTEIGA